MTSYFKPIAILMLFGMVWVGACKKKDTTSQVANSPLKITFQHYFGASPLLLGQAVGTPPGDPLTVTQLKYYVSNISAFTPDGKEVKAEGYFLVDEAQAGSKSITIKLPEGSYNKISYIIGVDSTRNVSGVQEGALDPANGMFWTWNSGYIMARLEGNSTASAAPFQKVTHHIGGFRTGESVLTPVALTLPAPVSLNPMSKTEVVIGADLNKWFTGANNIRIAEYYDVHQPGEPAVKIAANYNKMFYVKAVNQ